MTRSAFALALAACTPAPADEPATASTTGSIDASTGSSTSTGTGGLTDAIPGEVDLNVFINSGFALLDLDEDGRVDLLTDSYTVAVHFLRGRGDGSFEPALGLGDRLEYPANFFFAGDFDGDGARALAIHWIEHVALMRDPLHGSHEMLHAAAPGWTRAAADVDLDGRSDLFVVGSNLLFRLHGEPSGILTERPPLGLDLELDEPAVRVGLPRDEKLRP